MGPCQCGHLWEVHSARGDCWAWQCPCREYEVEKPQVLLGGSREEGEGPLIDLYGRAVEGPPLRLYGNEADTPTASPRTMNRERMSKNTIDRVQGFSSVPLAPRPDSLMRDETLRVAAERQLDDWSRWTLVVMLIMYPAAFFAGMLLEYFLTSQ